MFNPALKNFLRQLNLALIFGLLPILLLAFNAPIQVAESIDQWLESLNLSSTNDRLIFTCLFWWLPALVMFLLIRITGFDRWLKVNWLAHAGIAIGNLMMLIAVICRYTHFFEPLYMLNQSIFMVYCFAAIVMLASLTWHYVVKPSNKLCTVLLSEAFTQNKK